MGKINGSYQPRQPLGNQSLAKETEFARFVPLHFSKQVNKKASKVPAFKLWDK